MPMQLMGVLAASAPNALGRGNPLGRTAYGPLPVAGSAT